jgi:hypothetical protein
VTLMDFKVMSLLGLVSQPLHGFFAGCNQPK